MCWQVYLARWHETLVAVKLLIGSAAELAASSEEAADRVLSLSSPILANLQQVPAWNGQLHGIALWAAVMG